MSYNIKSSEELLAAVRVQIDQCHRLIEKLEMSGVKGKSVDELRKILNHISTTQRSLIEVQKTSEREFQTFMSSVVDFVKKGYFTPSPGCSGIQSVPWTTGKQGEVQKRGKKT